MAKKSPWIPAIFFILVGTFIIWIRSLVSPPGPTEYQGIMWNIFVYLAALVSIIFGAYIGIAYGTLGKK